MKFLEFGEQKSANQGNKLINQGNEIKPPNEGIISQKREGTKMPGKMNQHKRKSGKKNLFSTSVAFSGKCKL